jgi:hypothetical protein
MALNYNDPLLLESNIIPSTPQNIGALQNIYSSPATAPRERPVTNEDGTVTAPIYQLRSNTPTFDLNEMQNLYGTKYMPMFRWVSQQRTGEVTFDPNEGQITDEEADRLKKDFADEQGMSAEDALKQAGYATGGTIGSRAGGALTALMGSNVGFEDALMEAGKEAISLPFNFSKKGAALSPLKEIQIQQKADMSAGLPTSSAEVGDTFGTGNKFTETTPGASTTNYGTNPATITPPIAKPDYFGRVGNRLNPTTDIGMQNLKMAGGAALGNWAGRMIAGQDPIRAAEAAGKSFGVQYAATALTGSPLIGAIAGQFAQPILKKVKKLFKKLF